MEHTFALHISCSACPTGLHCIRIVPVPHMPPGALPLPVCHPASHTIAAHACVGDCHLTATQFYSGVTGPTPCLIQLGHYTFPLCSSQASRSMQFSPANYHMIVPRRLQYPLRNDFTRLITARSTRTRTRCPRCCTTHAHTHTRDANTTTFAVTRGYTRLRRVTLVDCCTLHHGCCCLIFALLRRDLPLMDSRRLRMLRRTLRTAAFVYLQHTHSPHGTLHTFYALPVLYARRTHTSCLERRATVRAAPSRHAPTAHKLHAVPLRAYVRRTVIASPCHSPPGRPVAPHTPVLVFTYLCSYLCPCIIAITALPLFTALRVLRFARLPFCAHAPAAASWCCMV